MLIGVNEFQHQDMQRCQMDTVMNDVEAIKEILVTKCDYPEGNIVMITGSEATRDGIKRIFDSELSEKINEDDRLLVFYSGHGVSRRKTRKQPEKGYLVTYDTQPNGRELDWQTMLEMDEFVPYVEKRILANHMLFLIDCCFSGLIHKPPEYEEHMRNLCTSDMCKAAKKKSVQACTAGGRDEEILASSGTVPPISVFVESIKQELESINPLSYPEGFVSASKLAHSSALQATRTSVNLEVVQIPAYYFFNTDDSGEFVFKQFSEKEIMDAKSRPQAALEPIEKSIQNSTLANIFHSGNFNALNRALNEKFPYGYSFMQLWSLITRIVNKQNEIVLLAREISKDTEYSEHDVLNYISTSLISIGLYRRDFKPMFVKPPEMETNE